MSAHGFKWKVWLSQKYEAGANYWHSLGIALFLPDLNFEFVNLYFDNFREVITSKGVDIIHGEVAYAPLNVAPAESMQFVRLVMNFFRLANISPRNFRTKGSETIEMTGPSGKNTHKKYLSLPELSKIELGILRERGCGMLWDSRKGAVHLLSGEVCPYTHR